MTVNPDVDVSKTLKISWKVMKINIYEQLFTLMLVTQI